MDPHHCTECGAWLATDTDTHVRWHTALPMLLATVEETANHADAFHRLYKGVPTR